MRSCKDTLGLCWKCGQETACPLHGCARCQAANEAHKGIAEWAIPVVQGAHPKMTSGRWRASWIPGDSECPGFWSVEYTTHKSSPREWSVTPVPVGPPHVFAMNASRG